MNKLNGVFDKCESFQTATKKTAYNVWISGKKFGMGFSDLLVRDLFPGTPVVYTTTTNGNFTNIASIERAPKETQPEVFQITPTPTSPSSSSYRTPLEISRTDALTLAVSVVNEYANCQLTKKNLNLPKRMELAVAFADHFFNYIRTGTVDVLNADVVVKIQNAVSKVEE